MLSLYSAICKCFILRINHSNSARNHIPPVEYVLYIWFAAFAYDELSEFIDAGSIFYVVDIWNGCDLIIVLIGLAFVITSKCYITPSAEGTCTNKGARNSRHRER
jgi:hypothetical protein